MRARPLFVPFMLACALGLAGAGTSAQAADDGSRTAEAALTNALAIPAGSLRDNVLRSVSRNLRWFGQAELGERAARAMSDGGASELPRGTRPGPPRFVPLREAAPFQHHCDRGVWQQQGGGQATSSAAREAWAIECLLERDFHWIGRPPGELLQAVAAGLPGGEVKASVLALSVARYPDPAMLRFARAELDRDGSRFPEEARLGLEALLDLPANQYRLGREADALQAARNANSFDLKRELIHLLIMDKRAPAALALFETLPATPPEFAEDCHGWFNQIGGLSLSELGNPAQPSAGLGAFLDGLSMSTAFAKLCPDGLPPELAVQHLLAAGRLDAAVAAARKAPDQPFLLIDALLQAGTTRLRRGELADAKRDALEAAKALPPFDPANPIPPSEPAGVVSMSADPANYQNGAGDYGERPGDTMRRFELIRLLAATGSEAEADRLAEAQPAGALRAVAFSAAVAGRAGYRFDDQAPSLSSIDAADLQFAAPGKP